MKADIYSFSCYIWNIEYIIKLTRLLKAVMPQAKIVLGGPEAGFNTTELFEKQPHIDYIICGEGEHATGELISALENNCDTSLIKNVATPQNPCPKTVPMDLNSVVFPYDAEDIAKLSGKVIYFETSRGCPFGCTYCLSSEDKSIRCFPMEYVKHGFDFFFNHNVAHVKLIDRTFNADNDRAVEIIEYIKKHSTNTGVHLEIEPHLLNAELTQALTTAPDGMFDLEIGIQTTNEKTLAAINRRTDFELVTENINNLRKNNNLHIHLDLIAGLPFEDKKSFEKSFDYVYSLKPDMLQLGFLKVLHHTQLEKDSSIVHSPFPPYEVLETPYISADELCSLKKTEKAVDRFYNSGAFSRTMDCLTKNGAFSVYEYIGEGLSAAFGGAGILRTKLYPFLYELYGNTIKTELVLDFLENNKEYDLPRFAGRKEPPHFRKSCIDFIKNEKLIKKYTLHTDLRRLRFEPVDDSIWLVDYKTNKIHNITKDFV